MDTETKTETKTEQEFGAVLALLPVAFQAVNLDVAQYPTSVEDGKDGERELHVKNQFNRTIRLVLQSPEEALYVLLVAKLPYLDAFVPYATKPYKVKAKALCCYLAHSLNPRPMGGGRAFSKETVQQKVLDALAQARQSTQPDAHTAVLGGQATRPMSTDAVLGGEKE